MGFCICTDFLAHLTQASVRTDFQRGPSSGKWLNPADLEGVRLFISGYSRERGPGRGTPCSDRAFDSQRPRCVFRMLHLCWLATDAVILKLRVHSSRQTGGPDGLAFGCRINKVKTAQNASSSDCHWYLWSDQ